MKIETKRYSKLLVGVRKSDGKGFVQPDDPAPGVKQRLESVTNWLGNNGAVQRAVDNVPMTGFKISGSAKRYSTSNKFVELQDPRGWEIEISIENFVYLAATVDIVKGVITTPLVYTRGGGSGNWLAVPDDECITGDLNVREKVIKLSKNSIQIGNAYELKDSTVLVFAGVFDELWWSYSYPYSHYGPCPVKVKKQEGPLYVYLDKCGREYIYKQPAGVKDLGPSKSNDRGAFIKPAIGQSRSTMNPFKDESNSYYTICWGKKPEHTKLIAKYIAEYPKRSFTIE